jgi:HEAT repeat protein
MGLFDFLTKKSQPTQSSPKKPSERELARLARLVGDKMSQNIDRQDAIAQLSELGTPEAAAALLKRFNWSMDPSITDQEEKEAAARGVVAAGEAALEPIRDYATKAESLTWPIKILRQIVSEDRIVDELLGILDEFDTEYVRNVEPKKQLVATLAEFPSQDVREAVEPFLLDISEPVRFEAVTTTFAMNDPECVSSLIEALAEEESLRVRNRIAFGLADRGWPISEELVETVQKALPPEFFMDGRRVRHKGA